MIAFVSSFFLIRMVEHLRPDFFEKVMTLVGEYNVELLVLAGILVYWLISTKNHRRKTNTQKSYSEIVKKYKDRNKK